MDDACAKEEGETNFEYSKPSYHQQQSLPLETRFVFAHIFFHFLPNLCQPFYNCALLKNKIRNDGKQLCEQNAQLPFLEWKNMTSISFTHLCDGISHGRDGYCQLFEHHICGRDKTSTWQRNAIRCGCRSGYSSQSRSALGYKHFWSVDGSLYDLSVESSRSQFQSILFLSLKKSSRISYCCWNIVMSL